MRFVQGIINQQVFGSESKPLMVDNSHMFIDNTVRDSYFTSHPAELKKDTYIQVGTGFQRYSGVEWLDVSSILQGQSGVGIPVFGTTGQILRKKSEANYDVEWFDKFPIRIESESYVVDVDDYIVICDFATDGSVTLPSVDVGKAFIIKSIGNGVVTFATRLDGISNFKLYKGGSVMVVSSGTNYYIISSAGYGI